MYLHLVSNRVRHRQLVRELQIEDLRLLARYLRLLACLCRHDLLLRPHAGDVLTLTVARGGDHKRFDQLMVTPVERSAIRNAAPRGYRRPSGLLGALIGACPVARGMEQTMQTTRAVRSRL